MRILLPRRGFPALPVLRLARAVPVLPALLALLPAGTAGAQPLLLIGKADAEISGAFSYDIVKSPLGRPMGRARAQASFNLPVNVSAQAQEFLGDVADSAVVVPDLFARVSQHLNAHIDVSAPALGGTAFFAARENASLTVSGALGDARFDMDTALEHGSVLLRGSIHLPLVFDMHWRSLTFGYAYRPRPGLALAFQAHKHFFSARTAGDLRPDLAGRMTVSGEGANTSFLVEYPDSRVYGAARGSYQGTAWSPEMGLALGPLRLVSRMGARMRARGSMDIDYSVPFFIDPESFEARFTEPDSFLATDNLGRLLNGETGRKTMRVREDLVLTLPQSHTLSLHLLRERLSLSYTRVFGRVSIQGAGGLAHAEPADGGNSSDGDDGGDSTLTSMGEVVDFHLFPNHVMLLSADFGWFRGSLGVHTLNIRYGRRRNVLSGLSPLEIDGDPLVPILNFGFTWGWPLVFSADFHVSPLPALRMGVSYGF